MSWSRHDGSAGAYSSRPARVGGSVTITWIGVELRAVRVCDADAAVVVTDAVVPDEPSRTRSSELGGHRLGDADRTADDAVLLGAAVGRDQRLEVGVGAGVEQRVQQRQVTRLGGPDRLADER